MKFTIELTDDNRLNFSQDAPSTFNTLALACFSAMLGYARTIVEEQPLDAQQKVKEELYDAINIAASNALTAFAPELELRPGLTEEAILRAENEILSEQTNEARQAELEFAKQNDTPVVDVTRELVEEADTEPTEEAEEAELTDEAELVNEVNLSEEDYAQITADRAQTAAGTAEACTAASEPADTSDSTAAPTQNADAGDITTDKLEAGTGTVGSPVKYSLGSKTGDANKFWHPDRSSAPRSAGVVDNNTEPQAVELEQLTIDDAIQAQTETAVRPVPSVRSKIKVG